MIKLTDLKTTLVGFLSLTAVGLYWGGVIDHEQLTVGMGVLMAAGLKLAKDA